MFWVWNQRSTNTEDELWVDFDVCVLGRVEQWNIEFCDFNATVWHSNLCFERSRFNTRFTKVDPSNVFVGNWTASKWAFGNGLW